MVTILAAAFLGAALAVLAGLIIRMAVLSIKKLYERLKKYHSGRVIIQDGKRLLAEIQAEIVDEAQQTKLEQLKEMLGEDSVVNAHTDENGMVIVDDMEIVVGEEMDINLQNLLDENDGTIKIAI